MRPPINNAPSAPDVTDSPATLPVVRISDGLGIPACLPQAKCEKCGSTNLKDTGSFMVEIHKCQDCGELFCEDSGGVGWDA